MALRAFIGTWEIIGCGYIYGTYSDNPGLDGVRFRLDENGDVTWTIPEEQKSLPLFNCETYELYSTTISGVVLRFGAYAGHVIEFRSDQIEPRDNLFLICDTWCNIQCKRICEITKKDHSIPFSLLPALEDGYFSDFTITSSNKKQFKVHLSILKLQASGIDWKSEPCPFSNLPEDVLGTILHFIYAECLPESLTEATAQQIIAATAQYPSLIELESKCKLYLKNMALKTQINGLVNDMHESMNQIIEHFNLKNTHSSSESITSNPGKLCFVVKQSIRDAAVASIKLLLLCDLFTKKKNDLSREERHEIIRYAKSRLPIFLMQLQKFLQALKNTFSSMSSTQRLEVATFLVPEIEIILDTISTLVEQVEKALHEIIQVLSPNDPSRSKTGQVGDVLGKSLKNVLHIRELSKLRNFHEHITYSTNMLRQKKNSFSDLSSSQKVRSIARNLEQLIEELPIFLVRLEEVTTALDEKLEWREFKFCFKVGTSKVSGILQKLVTHRETLQDVVVQLCELVQRDQFTQTLQILGILDTISASGSSGGTSETIPSTKSRCSPKHSQHTAKLNLVQSLSIPPTSSVSVLSKLALQLFEKATDTDMEFEINGQNEGETPSDGDEVAVIKAHRVIVAARCDWFRRALLSGMREAIDKKIIIHDTSPFLFRIFLEYLYSGQLPESSLSIEQLVELLLLSDRYEVDSLKQTCEYALQQSIDVDSALYFFNMADQYNAQILKNFCLNFICQHHELTESEVFFELPIALQAEIFDCVWTQPPPPKSTTMEQLLPSSLTASPDSSVSDRNHRRTEQNYRQTEYHHSNSSSLEDLPLVQDADKLDNCIRQLRDIIGDSAPREQLIQVVLAADYDLCRAVNFYYAKHHDEKE